VGKTRFLLIAPVGCALILATSAALRSVTTTQAPRARLALQPCHAPGVEGEVRCGQYEIYEDRAAKAGRKIALKIVVVPALNATPARDPVFWLQGGPGGAATQVAGLAQDFLAELRQERDLIFVDQRGTGDSHPLACDIADDPSDLPRFFGELFPAERIRACRERLEKNANLKLYTTPIAMDDLDEVRAALGYDKINLAAASYGTIAALVYVRQHPAHLRAVFLLGVANTNVRQPLPFAQGAQHALDLLFEDCAADKECQQAFPDLPKEFAAVMARFEQGSVAAQLVSPKTRQAETVNIARENFVERLRLLLYTTTFARFVPLIVHRAFENDYLPFETMALRYNPGAGLARGMYLTVTCSESVPFITEPDIVRQTQGAFVGAARVRAHIAACREWPQGAIPKSYVEPVKSAAPVLLVSGELDASTPPWLGKEAMRKLSNGRQVNIRYYGHQLDGPCVRKMLTEFIHGGSAKSVDATCAESIRRPPFAFEIPGQLSFAESNGNHL
jgi:pimeloyl-ACP methyl ester carboxylesterase